MQNIQDPIFLAKNMEKEISFGMMVALTKESLMKIIFMDKEYILGVMGENTKENGKKIKWMVKENLVGLMGENISGII